MLLMQAKNCVNTRGLLFNIYLFAFSEIEYNMERFFLNLIFRKLTELDDLDHLEQVETEIKLHMQDLTGQL